MQPRPKPGAASGQSAIFAGARAACSERNTASVLVFGYMPVVPMVFGSAILHVSCFPGHPPPSRATIDKYFAHHLARSAALDLHYDSS